VLLRGALRGKGSGISSLRAETTSAGWRLPAKGGNA
jgi:hypothetical protein